MTPMTCRNCGAGLAPDPTGRRPGIVVCEHCGSVHERASSVEAPSGAGAVPATPSAPRRIARPAGFAVERRDGALQVSWRKGRRRGAVTLGAFCLIWSGMALVSGAWPLLIVAPLLGYYALVRGMNRITVHADATALVVRQGPVPWPGARRLARADIEQMFSVEKVSTSRTGSDRDGPVRTRYSYRLRARLHGGRHVDVVGGLGSVDRALWLERETERALGIGDVPVEGELRR